MTPMIDSDADLRSVLEALPDAAGHDDTAPMLPAACYTSAAFFEFERTQVFPRSWICVGR